MQKLDFDFPLLKLATIENTERETGLTLLKFDRAMPTVCDIRGGAAAVRESSSVDELSTDGVADAIVLAGGSSFGLEAASGVMKKILEERSLSTSFADIPCVPSAIVYDFRNRTNKAAYPDKEMGEKAYDSLVANTLNIGAVGAGANVWVGKYLSALKPEKSGQGADFFEIKGVKILAITVLNALGNIIDFKGNIIAGSLDESNGERKDMACELVKRNSSPEARGNTTISVIVTNAKLTRPELKRLAIMAHTNMARVIDPFHTPWDGDVLFATSTEEIDLPSNVTSFDLGVFASRAMQNAVLSVFKKGE